MQLEYKIQTPQHRNVDSATTTTTQQALQLPSLPALMHPPQEFKYRVGFWWSDKKSQKLNATDLKALFAERDCELVKLDFDKPLEEQGPFSLIVHKISDILVKADQGDVNAKKTINAFESYVRKHPKTVILDPLDNNRALLDRYKQYRLIEQTGLAKEDVVFTPPFVHLTSTNLDVNRGRIRRSKLSFPLVCKPILAQGSTGAHQMCIIFNEAGLKDVKPPCVAQTFINHNARLFKLFVIKDKYYINERPSLKNFQPSDQETVFFYSHDISKQNSSSSLTELDELDRLNLERVMHKMKDFTFKTSRDVRNHGYVGNCNERFLNIQRNMQQTNGFHHKPNPSRLGSIDEDEATQPQSLLDGDRYVPNNKTKTNHSHYSALRPSDEKLSKIVRIFSEKLGLTFYGIDIIIEKGTSRYAIIDMNTFPGYDGVENFLTIFRDVVCDAIPNDTDHQLQSMQMKARKKPTEIDSGIEST